MAVKTFVSGEILTAADTNTYLNNGGLVWVANGSFSAITAASPLNVSNVFGSTMDNYRIMLELTTSGAANLVMRLRDSGGTISLTNYDRQNLEFYQTTVAAAYTAGANGWALGYNYGESKRTFISIDLISPNRAVETMGSYDMATRRVAINFVYVFKGGVTYNLTTQCTGFSFFPDANNATGNYWVYGYRQS